jgi:hypothetical protein
VRVVRTSNRAQDPSTLGGRTRSAAVVLGIAALAVAGLGVGAARAQVPPDTTPDPPNKGRFRSGPIHGAGFMTVTVELPSGRLVSGGDSQGFFVSDDGGRSWLSRNVLRGGADPFASRGVADLILAPVAGTGGRTPTIFAAVGKREQPTAAILRSDDQGETWVVDNGGKGIWFDGGNLPGAGSTRSRATSRLLAVADRGPYAAQPRLFAGDMTGCVWSRALTEGAAWAQVGCLPAASRSPIRSVAVSARGDLIVGTSRMGLAGSRGGGTLPQPAAVGAWRFVVQPACTAGPCTYTLPTSPLILFAAVSQSVEELVITPADHLYVAVVDDRLVNMPARIGGLWAGRPDGSPLVSVGVIGDDRLRNVVSVDLVQGSAAVDTVLTGASLPKAAATDTERTDFEVTRARVRWDTGPFPSPEVLEPLAQEAAVDLDLYGHDGLRWFVDGTSTLGNDQYVVSSVRVLSDGRYLVAGKAGLWIHHVRQQPGGGSSPPWRPAVFGIGSTFQGDVVLEDGTSYTTDADRFLFRADLTVPRPDVRHELDQAPTIASDVTKGLSVTVLDGGTALVGQATSTFGGLLLAVPPGTAPSTQLRLPVFRQPVALAAFDDAAIDNTVLVGIADNGLWSARWDRSSATPTLVDWRRLTTAGAGVPPRTAQPFETPALPDDVAPASATIVTVADAGGTVVFAETAKEGLWAARWAPGPGPLAWVPVLARSGLPGEASREMAYVRGVDALFLSGLRTLGRIDDPVRCLSETCTLAPVDAPVVGATGWTPLSTAYGIVPLAASGSTLIVVAGADPTLDKPGTVYRYDPAAEGAGAWDRLPDPDRVAANQLIRPIGVAAEGSRLAVTTSGNGLVVYGLT